MSLPGYTADASIYWTGNHYQSAMLWGGMAESGIAPARALLPKLPNGDGCQRRVGPCNIADPTCPSGKARLVQGTDCDTEQFCCPPICTTTCTACTGGSCNAWPNCGVANPGTRTCTDCHGNVSTVSC